MAELNERQKAMQAQLKRFVAAMRQLSDEAQELMEKKDYVSAKPIFERIIESFHGGEEYGTTPMEALAYERQRAKQDPHQDLLLLGVAFNASNCLGLIHKSENDYAAAETMYTSALDLISNDGAAPSRSGLWYNMYIQCEMNLLGVYWAQENWNMAAPLFRRSMIREAENDHDISGARKWKSASNAELIEIMKKNPDMYNDHAVHQIKRASLSESEHKCSAMGCPTTGQLSDFKRCARCKSALYCSKTCQTKDWKAGHKAICDSQVPAM
eukprot:GILK01006087.1.p1 GENE.GILK01006087.1~~GILK01006087.1.p1  ORF type:complete len:283 (+),score=30.11 GILK01006087.1:45-851(+)